MAQQHLLLVDGDPRSLRMMELSLRNAGFAVTTARNGREALDRCRASPPDLVLSDTQMPEMDGFELCTRLKEDERLRGTPFVFLTGQKSVEDKVRGLELGVEDYLTKPIYLREVVTRVKVLLERRERERLARRDQRSSFTGVLSDMSVVDLVQTLELGKKSGAIRLEDREGRAGTLWLVDGRVVDAEVDHLVGEPAFYRLVGWQEGRFDVDFGSPERQARIAVATPALLLEGMRRIDEAARLMQRLPPPRTVLQLDFRLLSDRLAEIPDEVNSILTLLDGRRTLAEVLRDSRLDDLLTTTVLARLWEEGIVAPGTRRASDDPEPAGPANADPALSPPHEPGEPGDGIDWFAGPALGEPAPAPPPLPSDGAAVTPAAAARAVEAGPGAPRIVRFTPRPRRPDAAPAEVTAAAQPPGRLELAAASAAGRARGVAAAGKAAASSLRRVRLGWVVTGLVVVGAAVGIGSMIVATRAPEPERPAVALAAPAVRAAAAVPRVEGVPAVAAGSAPSRQDAYQRDVAEGERALAVGDPAAAAEAYRRALDQRETGEALLGLGRALHARHEPAAAQRVLERAIEVDPRSGGAQLALGRVFATERRIADARAAFERCLELDPGGPQAAEARQALDELR